MAKGKNVLTTGDVARICNVAPRTVSKWFDSGQIKGYLIPGSRDRRIPVTELARFMKENNIPANLPPFAKVRVLVADSDGQAGLALAESLRRETDYEVQTARTDFEVGLAVQKFGPNVLLISLSGGKIKTTEICSKLRAGQDSPLIKIIALAKRLSNSERSALLAKGFDEGCVCNSSGVAEVIKAIQKVTSIV